MRAASLRTDEVSPTLTYIGEAPTGALPSQAVWRIMRIQVVGTETQYQFAGGDTAWNSVWNGRASLTYS